METTDTINPIEAITAEVEKALRAPDKLGLLSVRSANAWILDRRITEYPYAEKVLPRSHCIRGEHRPLCAL